jgi:amino acid permease
MGSASLTSSIVNLVKTIIGAGILGIPYAFGQCGLLLAAFVLLSAGLLQAFTLRLLAMVVLQERTKGGKISFGSMAKAAFGGSRMANALIEISNATGCYGMATSYLIVIGDLVPQVFEFAGFSSGLWDDRSFWISTMGWCIGLPLMCLQTLDSLKVTSMIGNFGIAYIVIIAVLFAAGALSVGPPPEQEASLGLAPSTAYTSMPGMFECASIYIFAFSCAQNIPTLVLELDGASMKRIDSMIMVGVGICTALFLVVGCCGSLAFGASVNGNLLASFPCEKCTVTGLAATAARLAIVLNVLGSFPLQMFPARASLSQLFFGKAPADLSRVTWCALTFGLFLLSWGVALSVRTLDVALAFVGATSGMLMGFSFPALLFARLCCGDSSSNGKAQGLLAENDDPQQVDHLRIPACLTAAGSLVLVPVLVGMQIFKMTQSS